MARGGNPRIYMKMDVGDVQRGTRKAEAALKHLDRAGSRSLKGLSREARGLSPHLTGAIAGFTSLAGAAALLKDSVDQTMALAKATGQLQRTTGLDVQEASAWVSVAKARGLESTKLTRGFVTLEKQLNAARQGSEKSTEALKALGLTQRDIEKGSFHDVIRQTADGYKSLEDPIKRAAIAQQLFGRGGVSLGAMLAQGAAGIDRYQKLARDLGATLDKDGFRNTIKLRDAQIKWNLSMQGLKNTLALGLMPALARGAQVATGFIREMRTGEGAGGRFAAKIKELWQNVKPTVSAIGRMAAAVGRFVAEHPGVQRMLAVLIPVGAALKVAGGASTVAGLTRLAGSLRSVGTAGKGAAVGATALSNIHLAAWFAGALITARNLAKSGIDPLNSKTITFRRALDFADRQGGAFLRTIGRIVPGMRDLGDMLHRVNQEVQGKLGKVRQYGQTWRDVANDIALVGQAISDLPSIPELSPNYPGTNVPQVPRGPGRRRGGMVYQAGGLVPSLLSPGELVITPGGGAHIVPGQPAPADNVPMLLPSESAVLTWDGQARMMAGATVNQAVAMQAPHFRTGGFANWTTVGASVYGGTPWDDNGKGSVGSNLWRKGAYPFAELNWGRALGGMGAYQKLYIRRGNRAVVGTREDVGPAYSDRRIDLHKQIAVALGISPTSFLGPVQIMDAPAGARPGPVDSRTLRETASGAASSTGSRARTVTSWSYREPFGGSGRVGRAAWESGWQAGVDDPFGLGRAQSRTDFYNEARGRIFGDWTKATRTIPGRPGSQPRQAPGPGGRWDNSRMSGVGRFGGYPVANWIIPILRWAQLKGWSGRLSSGFRSYAKQKQLWNNRGSNPYPVAPPGTSNHEGSEYPRGAIDTPDYGTLARLVGRFPGPRKLKWYGSGDRVHFSGTGRRRGGWVQRFRSGGVALGSVGTSYGQDIYGNPWRAGQPVVRQPLKDAQDGLGRLISIGVARADEPKVKAALARELKLIDRLNWGQTQEFLRVSRNFHSGVRGPHAQTMRARIQQIMDYAGKRQAFLITRPIGVSDSVQAAIDRESGQIADRLTVRGIDPESATGLQEQIGLNWRSVSRLYARRKALTAALARASRLRRPLSERRQIGAEIRDVDDQILGLRAANVRLEGQKAALKKSEPPAGDLDGGISADAQAMIDQESTRRTVAERAAGLSEAFIRTAFGSGDIGSGGQWAWTSAGGSGRAFGPGMNITINTLHPGDPQTLSAIAAAATAGMGQQGFVGSPREASGV